MKNLTLKRILKRHKENPQDKELHEVIENAEVNEKDFEAVVKKGSEQETFDKTKTEAKS